MSKIYEVSISRKKNGEFEVTIHFEDGIVRANGSLQLVADLLDTEFPMKGNWSKSLEEFTPQITD